MESKDAAQGIVVPRGEGHTYRPSTQAVHADDPLNSSTDVAPALHVSTTFRYASDPELLRPTGDNDTPPRGPHDPPSADSYIYSRMTGPNTSRLETVLTSLLHGPTLTYASGLAAFHALLIHVHPEVVAISEGYHGCHGVLALYQKLTNCRIVELHDREAWSGTDSSTKERWELGQGDLVHLETPLNPSGEVYEIGKYARWAHERGAVLSVDATFGPPPLQDPFAHGADYVMHSGTKYIGGHSDMLCGTLSISTSLAKRTDRPDKDSYFPTATTLAPWETAYWDMYKERVFLGLAMGSLEGWLGVRSLRTLELRVQRQSANATTLVRWLHDALSQTTNGASAKNTTGAEDDDTAAVLTKCVSHVRHASVQALTPSSSADLSWIPKQMPNGYGPVFALYMKSSSFARRLPSKLHLFHHATSLGGVESLIEWRRMSDKGVDERLIRVSIGVEDVRDLQQDLLEGFRALLAEEKEGVGS